MSDETKHTAGPWLLGDENDACAEVECGLTRISLDRTDPYTSKYVISREEMLANVHLVMAAPDLLAALEALTAAVTDGKVIDGHPQATREAIFRARETIARARGES
jgi:hypothetical protein